MALQWGHAFVSVETHAVALAKIPLACASMGPRFCKRGNEQAIEDVLVRGLLQWGHAFVSVETG